MSVILSYSVWIAFAIVCGILEALYYSRVYRHKIKRIKFDHAIFTGIRIIAVLPLLYFTFSFSWQFFVGGILLMMVFPFFHDGAYYKMRNILDGVYPKGWIDNTTTSDAKINLNFINRTILLIVSSTYFLL